MLSGRGLCDELITRPEESYRPWCVVVCDLETSRMGAPYMYDISRLRVKEMEKWRTKSIRKILNKNKELNEIKEYRKKERKKGRNTLRKT